jgi:hypothetical protein
MLAFVPRHQLGKIVPQIGDKQFARIAQSFLHNYGQIKLFDIKICQPHKKDPSNRPHLEINSYYDDSEPWLSEKMILPDVEMPENIKDFEFIRIGFVSF